MTARIRAAQSYIRYLMQNRRPRIGHLKLKDLDGPPLNSWAKKAEVLVPDTDGPRWGGEGPAKSL